MDAFVEAWRAIDKQRKGYITMENLYVYTRDNNYDDSFMLKYRNLFDKDRTGIIPLTTYCEVLGLDESSIWSSASTRGTSSRLTTSLPTDVNFISGDMSLEWQIKIVGSVKEALNETPKMSDTPKRIKATLDRLYGQLWHVVITQGQFWCHYGHEPAFSFVFQIEKKVFIIWKTPLA